MEPTYNYVELDHKLVSVGSLFPFLRHTSSQRQMMSVNQLSQSLLVKGATKRSIYTGAEREYGRYTWDRRAPANMEVVRLIHKYGQRTGNNDFKFTPTTLAIYRDEETLEFGCLWLDRFQTTDQNFGYEFVPTEAVARMNKGEMFNKDTVFMRSPAVDEDEDYRFGIEVPMTLMSLSAVIEDGVQVTDEICKELTTKAVKKVQISAGERGYLLNIFGTPENYKCLPDLGERVGHDGILAFTRKYNEDLSVVEMTDQDLMEPDFYFDTPVYIEPNARIIDINIIKQDHVDIIPETMTGQLRKYLTALQTFYKTILVEYDRLRKDYGDTLRMTPKFALLVEKAMGFVPSNYIRERLVGTYRNVPIDEWWIEITYEYDLVPTIGFKLSDTHGGKAVICDKIPAKDAPVDARGHIAHIVADDKSTIKRMNLGRLYERYFNSASKHLQEDIKTHLGIPWDKRLHAETLAEELKVTQPEKAIDCFKRLLDYYAITTPLQYAAMQEAMQEHLDYPFYHLAHVLAADNIRLYWPVDNPICTWEAVLKVEEMINPLNGPVSFTGRLGGKITTKNNIRIGSTYMVLLEKTATQWASVSSSKRQHFGTPAKRTNFDKHSSPIRTNPTRAIGESEQRNYSHCLPRRVTADIIDRSTNPVVHRQVCSSILYADDPMNIPLNVDRNEYPLGRGRVQQFVQHIIRCDGQELYREETNDEG